MDDMLLRLRLCRLSCRGEEKKDKGSQDWGFAADRAQRAGRRGADLFVATQRRDARCSGRLREGELDVI
jgi:hypothetical protein